MAEINPFRGLRYNPAKIQNLAEVVTPPYDVIPPDKQIEFHQRSPYNVIRLELGETLPSDDVRNNRHTRARNHLDGWLADGILTMDQTPAFYVCQDKFSLANKTRKRTGLIAALKTTPYSEGIVLPHEDTLPRAKADRLALLEACEANFSSIFALYRDQAQEVTALITPCLNGPPLATVVDDEGVEHDLWRLQDAAVIEALQRVFSDKKIFIADGHHRYETACRFAEEHGPQYASVMTTLFEMQDQGLVVMPTHRLLRNVGPIPWPILADKFERTSFHYPDLQDEASSIAGLLEMMDMFGAESPCLGIYSGGVTFDLLTLRNPSILQNLLGDQPQPYQELDVSILHELLLKPGFRLGSEEIASEGFVAYTRDFEEAWKRVRQGEFEHAIFLNPPTLDQVTAVATAGARMPQKSTFFWPKLITGMVMCRLGGNA